MRTVRFLLAALAAVMAITYLAHSAPAFAAKDGNPNEAAYWLTEAGEGATCVKHNPGEQTTDGQISDDGTAVTLNSGNWVLLVVKSGSAGDGDGNLVYHQDQLVAGGMYVGPTNGGDRQGAVSHWIICSGPGPQPAAQVTETWTDNGPWACGDTTVDQTHTVTTTPHVLVQGEWQLDTDPTHTTVETTHQARQLTADEQLLPCPPQPAAKVTETWTDSGPWACGDTTVDQTHTVTNTPYVLVQGEWQLDTDPTHTTVETTHQARQLTAGEQFPCDVAVTTQSPAFVEATCSSEAEIVLPDTPGVDYTASGPAAAGAMIKVTATAQQGYVLAGLTEWTHTFTTLDPSECSQSQPADPQTGSEQGSVDTPGQQSQSASEAPAPTTAPTTQLPKTGKDHVTLLALIALVVLGGGVALRAVAARRRA